MMIFFVSQANRGSKMVQENKKESKILYTLTIAQASTKDSGTYSCSITDVASRDTETKEIVIQVFGMSS